MAVGERSAFEFKIYAEEGSGVLTSGCHRDAIEILEVTGGSIKIEVGTESSMASEGDYIYIPERLAFRAEAVEGDASVRSLSFNSVLVTEHMEKFDSELFYMFCVQSRNRMSVFRHGHPIYETVAYAMTEAYDEYAAKDVCYKLPIRANIYVLISALLRYYCGARNEQERMVYHNVLRLRPALDYIADHCGEKIYIDTLAEMISVSADYFTKMFKESIGKTPIDYINGVRVNKALELLSVSDTPLNDIADKSGFANPNYFHKIFKQYMNTSPLAYRKSIAK
ncbi:MAG: helix-turn-helix domain-containing protein [Clostridia bacterium]|nr:helix-turn-helix domain-containing protein [Clostridia bacterium]